MKNLLSNKILVLSTLFLVVTFLGFRILNFTDTYGCTLIVMDKWQTLDPLFYNLNWWEGFAWQHGPHRLGLIYFIFKIDAYISDWNNRMDLFVQAVLYILTTLLALKLKVKLFGKLKFSDVIIPLIFLTPHAGTTMLNNPFVHGLLPLLAISLCYIYFIKSKVVQLIVLSIYSFLSAFTGFAFILIPVIVVVEIFKMKNDKSLRKISNALPSLIGILSFAYIFITNVPKPSSETYSFSLKTGIKYALALAGNIFLITPKDNALIIVAIALLAVFFLILYLLLKTGVSLKAPTDLSIIVLLGSTVVFWILNIYGRAHFSVGTAMSSRYIPVGMMFALSLYFLILKLDVDYIRLFGISVLLFLLIHIQLNAQHRYEFVAERSSYFKSVTNCLLEENNFDNCKGENSDYIHPDPNRVNIQEKLNFLKENKLNIFNVN